MATAPGNLPIELTSDIATKLAEYDVVARRLWVWLYFDGTGILPVPERCLVDTGAPLCVIPREIYEVDGLEWEALSDQKKDAVTTWQGMDCDIGRVRVWYKPFAEADPRGPFDLIGKFPRRMLKKEPRQQNSWVNFGSGKSPSWWYKAVSIP